jgi:hypothetical protein
MLTAPDDLPPETIVAVLAEHWGLAVDTVTYCPVGWGSHHWAARNQWFVTVDELEVKRHTEAEALDLAYERLRAALAAAAALPSSIVVAPVPARSGDPVVRCADRYAMAVYPYVEAQSYSWGEFSSPAHRQAVLDLLVRVHTSGVHSGISDDFGIAHRDALDPALPFVDSGPYAQPAAELLAAHAAGVRQLLARYDALVTEAEPAGMVLTHGEPHPGNTMLGPAGWVLIDWDTALMAPPERDLWGLDPGDGSILTAYQEATGIEPRRAMLELYRLRWDLLDLAVDVSRFRRPHTGNADDDKSFDLLRSLLTRCAQPRR